MKTKNQYRIYSSIWSGFIKAFAYSKSKLLLTTRSCISGSIWPSFFKKDRIFNAWESFMGFLYGRSLAVNASKISATAMMRDCKGRLPLLRCLKYPDPSSFSWCPAAYRITSYNVCYTKLFRAPSTGPTAASWCDSGAYTFPSSTSRSTSYNFV